MIEAGTRARDMSEYPDTLVVNVTAEDIAHGEHYQCYRCPIARAALRAFGEPDDFGTIEVTTAGLDCHFYLGDDRRVRYAVPQSVVTFIVAFDGFERVDPFTFTATLARRF